jgi:hypothetical protein
MKFLPGVLNKEEGTLGRRAALRFTLGEVLEHALFHPLLAQGVALPERQVGDGPGIFRHLLT